MTWTAPPRRFHFGDEGGELAVGRERAVGDRLVDARQVLHHHAAGAEIHVADFGIAHLPLGQPDMQLRRLEKGDRRGLGQAIEAGRLGAQNGVVGGGLVAMAPAVEHGKHDRTLSGNESGHRARL